MAVTAQQLQKAIHGKTVQAPTGAWHISVVEVQTPADNTSRILDLTLVGSVTFSLRLEVLGKALLKLRADQDLASWVLQKVCTYLAFNPGIQDGDSRAFRVTEP